MVFALAAVEDQPAVGPLQPERAAVGSHIGHYPVGELHVRRLDCVHAETEPDQPAGVNQPVDRPVGGAVLRMVGQVPQERVDV